MGSLCQRSQKGIIDYSPEQDEKKNKQKSYVSQLVRDMNDESIYISNEQQQDNIHYSNQIIIEEQKDIISCQNFFKYQLKYYEQSERIFRKNNTLQSNKLNLKKKSIKVLRNHENQLIKLIKNLQDQLNKSTIMPQKNNYTKINFRLEKILLKNTDKLENIDCVQISYELSDQLLKIYPHKNSILINMQQTQSITTTGTIQYKNTASRKYQQWLSQHPEVRFTKSQQFFNFQKHLESKILNMTELISMIIIKINFKGDQKPYQVSIPLDKQLFANKYPVQRIMKICNTQSSISVNSLSQNDLGVIIFRIQKIDNDELNDIKQILNKSKSRIKMLRKYIDDPNHQSNKKSFLKESFNNSLIVNNYQDQSFVTQSFQTQNMG